MYPQTQKEPKCHQYGTRLVPLSRITKKSPKIHNIVLGNLKKKPPYCIVFIKGKGKLLRWRSVTCS